MRAHVPLEQTPDPALPAQEDPVPDTWPGADEAAISSGSADLGADSDETDMEIFAHEFGSFSRWSVTKARTARLRLHAFRCTRSASHADQWSRCGVSTVWPSVRAYTLTMERAFDTAPATAPDAFLPPSKWSRTGSSSSAHKPASTASPPSAAAGGGGQSASSALCWEAIHRRHGGTGLPMPLLCHGNPPLWMTDEAFCAARLVGPNAASLQLVERESWLTGTFLDMPFSTISGRMEGFKNIDQAIQARRVFMIDHTPYLTGFVNRRTGRHTSFPCPQALFFVDSKKVLRPLCVVVSPPGDLRYPINPIYTPDDNVWAWLAAKILFNTGDLIVHLVVNVMIRTYFLSALAMCLIFRTMHPVHPFSQLTFPFLGNAVGFWSVWEKSHKPLMLSATCIRSHSLRVLSERAWAKLDVINSAFRNSVSLRIPDPKLLGPRYRFATDGLEVWDAMLEYVHSIVRMLYPTASARDHDTEGREFLRELTTFTDRPMEYYGNSHVYPMSFNLATMLAASSLQASTFTHDLYDWYGCVAFAPLRPRTPFPRLDEGKDAVTEADVAAMLPTTRDTIRQMALMHVLSGRPLSEASLAASATSFPTRVMRAVERPARRARAAVQPIVARCLGDETTATPVAVATLRAMAAKAAQYTTWGPPPGVDRYEGESAGAVAAAWSGWAAQHSHTLPPSDAAAASFAGLAPASLPRQGMVLSAFDAHQLLSAARAERTSAAGGALGGGGDTPAASGAAGDGASAAAQAEAMRASASASLRGPKGGPRSVRFDDTSSASVHVALHGAESADTHTSRSDMHSSRSAGDAATPRGGDVDEAAALDVAVTQGGVAPSSAELSQLSLSACEKTILLESMSGRTGRDPSGNLLLSLPIDVVKDARCEAISLRFKAQLARVSANIAKRNAETAAALAAEADAEADLLAEGRPSLAVIQAARTNAAYRAAMWCYRAADPLRVPMSFAKSRCTPWVVARAVYDSVV